MGNQPSSERAADQSTSSSQQSHSRSQSLRHRPPSRRLQPPTTTGSSREDSTATSNPGTPERTDSPKSPDLAPLSPTSLYTPSSRPHPYTYHRHHYRTPSAASSDHHQAHPPRGDGHLGAPRTMGNTQSNEQWAPPASGPGSSGGGNKDSRKRGGTGAVGGGGGGTGGFEGYSSPMLVPGGGMSGRARDRDDREALPLPAGSDDYAPKSNLNFPPRLPLPIQEEPYMPGSPIISPDDLSRALREDSETALPHRTSLLSHTTADDDDETAELETDAGRGRTVPTVIRWRGTADRVYVTGSFAAWARKFRMHRDPRDAQLMTAKLDLPPGTHHVKFIVDGDMQLSTDLPTAVDYTNILVNYVEVSADDIPLESTAIGGGKDGETAPSGLHPPLVVPPGGSAAAAAAAAAAGGHGGVEQHDFAEDGAPHHMQQLHAPHPQHPQTHAERQASDAKRYVSTLGAHYSDRIPQYLPDLDREEGSNRFRRSANHIHDVPTPPSLPLFLGKSILNGTTPMKDDSSVLNMPNHTVLNHLATSSIKNDVLATSLTTRYKRKYVTTITYRPTKEDD